MSAVGVLKSFVFAVSNDAPRARPAAERSHLRWNNEALALDHCSPKVQNTSQCVDNRLRSSRVPLSALIIDVVPSPDASCLMNALSMPVDVVARHAPTCAGTMRRASGYQALPLTLEQ